ncbi:MAG: hypothetical protein ACTHXA_09965 [Gulosibacter sp.]|uniref:hypothetical protein n=1 Tax=Gulosibacter sp. TaxID=2817531 RepID=UPI003F8EF1B5
MQILFARQFESASVPTVPLHQLAARNNWARIYRGAYLQIHNDKIGDLDSIILHAAKVIAVSMSTSAAVVSGLSAAILHDLPISYRMVPDRVHVTRSAKSRATEWIISHQAELSDEDIVEVSGIRCTSVLRTIQDLAGVLELYELLAIADTARSRGIDLAPLQSPRRNGRKLRWLVAHASDRSESFAESWSRCLLISAGMDLPLLQPSVLLLSNNRFLGRPDFGTPDGLLGEFDGRIKYGALTSATKTAADVVMDEKRRENGLRDANYELFRWDWQLLRQPELFIQRWRNAEDRARQLPAPLGRYDMLPVKQGSAKDWRSHFEWDPDMAAVRI